MNLYKISCIFSLSLFFISTTQHVCTDQVNFPIIVQRTLGQGSQGKAEEVLANRKQFVLKTFLDNGSSAQNLKEAGMHKMLSSKDVNQQHVVKYELCFKKNNHYQVLMEYFPSNWDASYYRTRIMEKDEVGRAKVYKSLIEKIQFMHQQGVLHCDLKPDNIFCDQYDIGKFKLGDFGLSKYKNDPNFAYKCSAGALGYIAPETNKGGMNVQDAGKYDMFSAGIIIAQIETKRTCDVLEASKDLQNTIFNTVAYRKFLEYVESCLPRNSTKQLIINKLILGLLVKDESERYGENDALYLLQQVISGNMTSRKQNLQKQYMSHGDDKILKQPSIYKDLVQKDLMNKINVANQLQQRQQPSELPFNRNIFNKNQPIKPIHNMNVLQQNGQFVINTNQQIQQKQNADNFQKPNQVMQPNFFNRQPSQNNKRGRSIDFNPRQNKLNPYEDDQGMMQAQQIEKPKKRDRQYLLAKRNRSNDIWGVMNSKNKILI